MMYNIWDRLSIHWINYKIFRNSHWYYLNNDSLTSWSNSAIFDKLWIKDKYVFCETQTRLWDFPYHNTIEQLNVTIQKLLNYWQKDSTFYERLMYNE